MPLPSAEAIPTEARTSLSQDDCKRVFTTSKGHVATPLTVPAILILQHKTRKLYTTLINKYIYRNKTEIAISALGKARNPYRS